MCSRYLTDLAAVACLVALCCSACKSKQQVDEQAPIVRDNSDASEEDDIVNAIDHGDGTDEDVLQNGADQGDVSDCDVLRGRPDGEGDLSDEQLCSQSPTADDSAERIAENEPNVLDETSHDGGGSTTMIEPDTSSLLHDVCDVSSSYDSIDNTTNSSTNPWVCMSGGEFLMGRGESKGRVHPWVLEPYFDSAPEHRVILTRFDIQQHEVTVAEYERCVQAGRCEAPVFDYYNKGCLYKTCAVEELGYNYPFRRDYPVNGLVWSKARTYCQWIGGDLPTEAQWEYAARGGRSAADYPYPWGNEPKDCSRAYYTFWDSGRDRRCGEDMTVPVCATPSGNSPEGLCDMLGNAAELTRDYFDSWHLHEENPSAQFDYFNLETADELDYSYIPMYERYTIVTNPWNPPPPPEISWPVTVTRGRTDNLGRSTMQGDGDFVDTGFRCVRERYCDECRGYPTNVDAEINCRALPKMDCLRTLHCELAYTYRKTTIDELNGCYHSDFDMSCQPTNSGQTWLYRYGEDGTCSEYFSGSENDSSTDRTLRGYEPSFCPLLMRKRGEDAAIRFCGQFYPPGSVPWWYMSSLDVYGYDYCPSIIDPLSFLVGQDPMPRCFDLFSNLDVERAKQRKLELAGVACADLALADCRLLPTRCRPIFTRRFDRARSCMSIPIFAKCMKVDKCREVDPLLVKTDSHGNCWTFIQSCQDLDWQPAIHPAYSQDGIFKLEFSNVNDELFRAFCLADPGSSLPAILPLCQEDRELARRWDYDHDGKPDVLDRPLIAQKLWRSTADLWDSLDIGSIQDLLDLSSIQVSSNVFESWTEDDLNTPLPGLLSTMLYNWRGIDDDCDGIPDILRFFPPDPADWYDRDKNNVPDVLENPWLLHLPADDQRLDGKKYLIEKYISAELKPVSVANGNFSMSDILKSFIIHPRRWKDCNDDSNLDVYEYLFQPPEGWPPSEGDCAEDVTGIKPFEDFVWPLETGTSQ